MPKTTSSLISPLQAELESLRAKLARRREYMDLLELELTNTRGALQEFTDLYNHRIGPLEAHQQRLQRQLEELTADQAPPSNDWRGARRGPGRFGAAHVDEGEAQEPEAEHPFKRRAAPTSQDVNHERRVRDLFWRLAKRYHPDVAQDDEQRKWHEEIMAEVNQAYSAKNLQALEALDRRMELEMDISPTPAVELARLTVELRQLETLIFDMEQTIRDLDLSPAMQMRTELRTDQEDGRDTLAALEREMRSRIAALEEQVLVLGGELAENEVKTDET
ncbi:MAG: J domain-containing protein [Anaerolineales bacterium]|nr:MAG: J domain-containing protein [Anaerolineales bacterium]